MNTPSVLHIRHGRVIDASQNLDAVTDLWLAAGRVAGFGPQPHLTATEVIDATGLIVSPGLIDMLPSSSILIYLFRLQNC